VSYNAFKRTVRTRAEADDYGRANGYKPGFAFKFMQEQRQRQQQEAAA